MNSSSANHLQVPQKPRYGKSIATMKTTKRSKEPYVDHSVLPKLYYFQELRFSIRVLLYVLNSIRLYNISALSSETIHI